MDKGINDITESEVKMLRDEIMKYFDQITFIVQLSLATTTAIIGWGASKMGDLGNCYIILLSLLIQLPCVPMIMNRRYALMRIATYLRKLGPNANAKFNWEYNINLFRKLEGGKSRNLSWKPGRITSDLEVYLILFCSPAITFVMAILSYFLIKKPLGSPSPDKVEWVFRPFASVFTSEGMAAGSVVILLTLIACAVYWCIWCGKLQTTRCKMEENISNLWNEILD